MPSRGHLLVGYVAVPEGHHALVVVGCVIELFLAGLGDDKVRAYDGGEGVGVVDGGEDLLLPLGGEGDVLPVYPGVSVVFF